jgi:hypothetical protein
MTIKEGEVKYFAPFKGFEFSCILLAPGLPRRLTLLAMTRGSWFLFPLVCYEQPVWCKIATKRGGNGEHVFPFSLKLVGEILPHFLAGS